MTVFEELTRRGLIAQMTHPEKIEELLNNEKVTFYIGFDATADSLHVGHFLQLVVMRRLQLAGHRPIALLGTGTTLIGDPTGRTDMRKMLTPEAINYNAECFKRQMEKFIDFSDDRALMLRNGDWLCKLNYIELLRDVGVYFSVNQMLTMDSVKTRLERGLSFLEFNYMIMQSYDFYHMFKHYGCNMQCGGNDQWSNMLGGTELIRKKLGKDAHCLTITLLTDSQGNKMGKTAGNAVWLDPQKTSPYEFFQYWRNVDDADVVKCLKMLTFIPVEEIDAMAAEMDINRMKERLAHELTSLVHGAAEADKALEAARALFAGGAASEHMPSTSLAADALAGGGIGIIDLLTITGLAASRGEARRLVEQGGVAVDDEKITDFAAAIPAAAFEKGYVVIRKGKKVFHKAVRS